MLQKAQANVKHLEAQIKPWRVARIVSLDAPTILPGSIATPGKAAVAIPAKPIAAASPQTTTATPGTVPAGPGVPVASPSTAITPAALPKKPVLAISAFQFIYLMYLLFYACYTYIICELNEYCVNL